MREVLADVLAAAGIAGLVYGAWAVYEPLAYLAAGVAALAVGVLISRGGNDRKRD